MIATVGETLEPLTFQVSYTTLAMDVAGTRDLYPIHHDPDFARANGVRNIFLNTMWYQGLLGRYVSEWGGSNSFLRKMKIDMKFNGCPGDTLVVRGTVIALRTSEDGNQIADLEITVDNGDHPGAVLGSLSLELA